MYYLIPSLVLLANFVVEPYANSLRAEIKPAVLAFPASKFLGDLKNTNIFTPFFWTILISFILFNTLVIYIFIVWSFLVNILLHLYFLIFCKHLMTNKTLLSFTVTFSILLLTLLPDSEAWSFKIKRILHWKNPLEIIGWFYSIGSRQLLLTYAEIWMKTEGP